MSTLRIASLYCWGVTVALSVLLVEPWLPLFLKRPVDAAAPWIVGLAFLSFGLVLTAMQKREWSRLAWRYLLRGVPAWVLMTIGLIVLLHLTVSVSAFVGATMLTVFFLLPLLSAARTWGARRVCAYGHDAGFEPRYCPVCGGRTEDPFLSRMIVGRRVNSP